jgi:competence protein ComEC
MILLYMVMGWCMGLLAGTAEPTLRPLAPPIAAGCLAFAVIYGSDRRFRFLTLSLMMVALGLWRAADSVPSRPTPTDLAFYNDADAPIELAGMLVAPPEPRENSVRLRLAVERITIDGQPRPVTGLALIYADPLQADSYRYGDEIRAWGLLQTPPDFDTFSYRDYLAREGIYSTMLRARITVTGRDQGSPILAAIYAIREGTRERLTSLLPDPAAALLVAILTGDERGIAPEVAESFRLTGTSHLIAISGSNMAVVAALILALCRLLPGKLGGKWPAALIALIGIGLYTVFAGASASVVRAALMSGLALIAGRVGRPANGLTALATAIFIMTLVTPSVLSDAGLILSASATLGLVVYMGVLSTLTERLMGRLFAAPTAKRITAALADSVLVGLAAQVTTLPISLLMFGQFSALSFPINILVAPAQPYIMTFGIAAAALAWVVSPLGQIGAWLAAIPLTFSLAVIRAGAGLPGAASAVNLPTWVALVYYATLFGVTAYGTQHPYIRARLRALIGQWATPGIALAGLGVATVIWSFVLAQPDGKLHVWLIPSIDGAVALIQSPNGAHLLINGGDSAPRLQTALGDHLPPYKRRIDTLIVTTSKTAALRALPATLARYPVTAALIVPEGKTAAYTALRAALNGPLVADYVPGQGIQTTDGLEITFVGSDPLAVRLRYGSAHFLIADPAAWKADDIAAIRGVHEILLHAPTPGLITEYVSDGESLWRRDRRY